jgi:pimeloyl-ACP methyl ester carboxylesterase
MSAGTAENLTVAGPSATFTYRRLGPRGGVPLVLLTRFRGTIDWWDPRLLDHLATGHDVIVFDNVGTGYTTGTPRDTAEGFADGAIEFVEALGLSQVDLLGWTLGGNVAHHVTLRRPDLVRKLIVAAGTPGGRVPGAPPPSDTVRRIMAKPEVTGDDMVRLFFPGTDTGRAAGYAYLARVAGRLAAGGPGVSEEAARGQLAAITTSASVPIEEVEADLGSIAQPVLYATGVQDAMIPALASFHAVGHLANAVLVGYGDAGHAFLFQHPEDFATQVTHFLAS